MLKDILCVSGKPGLYKLISQGKNMIIVESLTEGKRQPIYAHEKVMSLGDIAIFTQTGDLALNEVFKKIQEKEEGKKSIDPKSPSDKLKEYFTEIMPDYDRDRVYITDMKKVISWYNTLIDKGYTDFSKKEVEKAAETEEA